MEIYLVRHGQTDWNLQRRYQGIEDIPLNKTGMEQAQICAECLKSISFAAIYSSPLKRAFDTARIIAGERYSVILDERLLERDFGKISGLLPEERETFLAEKKEANMESFDHLTSRVMQALHEYKERYQDDKVLVVAHGGVINAVLYVLTKGEIGTGKTLIPNTAVTILEEVDGELQIQVYNKKLI